MSEYGLPGIPDDVREGGAHREKKSAVLPLEVIAKLRAFITRASVGLDKQDVRELHQILLTIHPDVSPGKTSEEMAAFERLTKVATQVLSWHRDGKIPSYRDTSKLLDELLDIESTFTPRGSGQPSGGAPWRAGPGDSWWRPDSGSGSTQEDWDEEEKPPYETEKIAFDRAFVGKRMFEVKIDLGDDIAAFVIDPKNRGSYYGGLRALRYFEIEGVDGVAVAYRSSPDEFRSNFGGWKVIKGLNGRRIRELGTIRSFENYDIPGDGDIDGYDRGTRVILSNGTLRFGTSANDPHYPSGYCDIR